MTALTKAIGIFRGQMRKRGYRGNREETESGTDKMTMVFVERPESTVNYLVACGRNAVKDFIRSFRNQLRVPLYDAEIGLDGPAFAAVDFWDEIQTLPEADRIWISNWLETMPLHPKTNMRDSRSCRRIREHLKREM